ncbi:MAG: hypothetical protein M1837_001948 [Sclerophora amabilis]|nr:MAG: hypothetical protein M1837_001948 [Sclerophora amabilis]
MATDEREGSSGFSCPNAKVDGCDSPEEPGQSKSHVDIDSEQNQIPNPKHLKLHPRSDDSSVPKDKVPKKKSIFAELDPTSDGGCGHFTDQVIVSAVLEGGMDYWEENYLRMRRIKAELAKEKEDRSASIAERRLVTTPPNRRESVEKTETARKESSKPDVVRQPVLGIVQPDWMGSSRHPTDITSTDLIPQPQPSIIEALHAGAVVNYPVALLPSGQIVFEKRQRLPVKPSCSNDTASRRSVSAGQPSQQSANPQVDDKELHLTKSVESGETGKRPEDQRDGSGLPEQATLPLLSQPWMFSSLQQQGYSNNAQMSRSWQPPMTSDPQALTGPQQQRMLDRRQNDQAVLDQIAAMAVESGRRYRLTHPNG